MIPAFLARDFSERFSQPLFHDRKSIGVMTDDIRLNRVRSIEPAAESGFQNDDVDLCFGKNVSSASAVGNFKKRSGADPNRERDHELSVRPSGDRFLAESFRRLRECVPKRDEMRGSEQAGAIVLRTQIESIIGADGAFPIRAGDVNYCPIAEIDMQLREQSPNIFQPKLDPETLKAVKPCERVFVLGSRHFPPLRDHIHGATAK
jgi:hypothetical protein